MATAMCRRLGRRRVFRRVACVTVLLVAFPVLRPIPSIGAAPASAASAGTVTNYGNNIYGPAGIVTGPDGALWFTNSFGTGSIGRITTAGAITTFTDPRILGPVGITVGPDGALWFTTNIGSSIGRITTAGAVTTYTDPSIFGASAITAGPDGALWFTNQYASSIGRITTAGAVTHFTDPGISYPGAITAGPDGALWFTNGFGENSIGRITTAGAVTKFTDPGINSPAGIVAGPDGALWFTNGYPSSVGRITTAGVVTTFADSTINSPGGIVAGPDGALWFTNGFGANSIGRITTAGAVTNFTDASINAPSTITAGPDGALWFTNQYGSSIGRITTAGALTDYSGSRITHPFAITTGPDGALWFTNQDGDSIGRITRHGTITHYTGTGISRPAGITVGADGALWFTNQGNSSIGRITTAGTVTNYTGAGINIATEITAGPDRALWFTNQGNDSIGRITIAGTVTNHRGTGVNVPVGITAGPDGALWFTNRGGDSIGRITVRGRITNYRGRHINRPFGIVTGPDGALWFTNAGNSSIGRISTRGTVSNYTGTGVDGPAEIASRPDGSLWFTNKGNGSIGRINTRGTVTNYTGTGINNPIGIAAGPDGAMWFTNFANNSIGRITTGVRTAAARSDNAAPRASPIVDVGPDNVLDCTTSSMRSDWLQFFSFTLLQPAKSCATVVQVPGFGLFGPPAFGDDAGLVAGTTLIPYQPVSQTTVPPSRENGRTLTAVTVVSLPGTGLLLRQTDTYVSGQDSVSTSVRIENAAAVARDVIVYRTGDCFPGSDPGYGISRSHAVGCEQAIEDGLNAVPVAGPLYMRWDRVQGASHFHVAAVGDVRAAIGAGGPLADKCDCAKVEDIAAALSWSLHIAAGRNATVAHRLTYSVGEGRHETNAVAGAAIKRGVRRFTARLTSGGHAISGAPIDFVVGSLTACTAVTQSNGTASCVTAGPVPEFVARYRGDTAFKPAIGTYTPKRPLPPPPDPPGFPACAHFDRTGLALVTGGDAHHVTVLSTTEAPPCPIVRYTAYGDGVEIGAMRGDLRATDLFGAPVPGMAVLFIDAPFGSLGETCIYLTATDTRTGALLDTYAGSRDGQHCIDAVGGQKYR